MDGNNERYLPDAKKRMQKPGKMKMCGKKSMSE